MDGSLFHIRLVKALALHATAANIAPVVIWWGTLKSAARAARRISERAASELSVGGKPERLAGAESLAGNVFQNAQWITVGGALQGPDQAVALAHMQNGSHRE